MVESGSLTNFTVCLRPLRLGDIEKIWLWHNDEELYSHLVGDCLKPKKSDTTLWLKNQIESKGDRFSFAICSIDNDEHIGNVYLREVNLTQGSAVFHIFIGNCKHRGLHYGRQALNVTLNFAFKQLNLNMISLTVLASNLPAIRIYKNAGFEEKQEQAQLIKKGDVEHEVIQMILQKKKWDSLWIF